MIKLLFSASAIAGLSLAGHAQQVLFRDDNQANPASYDVVLNGMYDTTQDFNAQLLVGSTAGNVTTDVVTLLLSQTTATMTTALGSVQPAKGDITTMDLIADQTDNAYDVPAGTDYYEILLWSGNYTSYAAAEHSFSESAVYLGSSGVQQFNIDSTPGAGLPPAEEDLASPIYMYNIVLPEPSTLAMAGVGIGSMLIFGRRKFARLG